MGTPRQVANRSSCASAMPPARSSNTRSRDRKVIASWRISMSSALSSVALLQRKDWMNLSNATIGQLLIPVDDLDRAVPFYRDVLGLQFLFSATPQMAFFQCG